MSASAASMLSAALLAAALSASATSATAFGDLDCIGLSVSPCEGADCIAYRINTFFLFDWSEENSNVTFPYEDVIVLLPLLAHTTNNDGTTGHVVFQGPSGNGTEAYATFSYVGQDVSVVYSLGDPYRVHTARCDQLEAA